ncbi:MAG TPA: M57 family metalloprotease [Nitrososphaeraceae archaeon]|nr:M57 family metalloprotease [Nitrososphaeraceae archaeon]
MRKLILVIFFFFGFNLIIFNFHYFYSFAQISDNLKKQIEICCTWGEKFKDGILTYKISNASPNAKNLVVSALNYWEKNVEGIKFKEAEGKEQADIKITFRIDNGKVAGQTTTNFDSRGFIYDAKISLAEKAFGKQLNENIIEYISKHEIGHALGLGHANFKESLMSSLVYDSYNVITDCEREAFAEANKWKIIDNLLSPEVSSIKQYYC